ncbi:MAG TPA: TolC family protein [Bryobacteraceae bacterium]|nr:TolC family protein [Bryobacteraceae bacterium]
MRPRTSRSPGLLLLAILLSSPAWAQRTSIAPAPPQAPAILRPYLAPEVPPVRLANTSRLQDLVRAGTLYLTVQDAIALALENNIDIEVARYNPLIMQWNVTRSQAGGALPGVPSNASQAGSVATGQGVAGSQAAAGVNIPGTGAARAQSTNATISQIGPITPTLDPIVQEASTASHTTSLYPNSLQSATSTLVDQTRAHSLGIQQGLLTGGTVSLTYTDHYLQENAPTDVLNPTSAPVLSLSVQQYLLNSAGIAVNARFITAAKINRDASDLVFQTTVTNTVAQVLGAYYALEADYEDVKAKRNAAETAATFLENVKRQVQIGTLSPTETINAESLSVTARQALVDSETALQQQEVQLKSLLSRNGTADPVLAGARILPVDPIQIPATDDLPPLEELVKEALANRTDLATEHQNELATEATNLGTRNGVLPFAVAGGNGSQAGIAGTGRTVSINGYTVEPNPYFVGGIGTALGQVFRRNFPSENGYLAFGGLVRNRQAQADYDIDQLSYRQTQLSVRKDINQVQVDVQNYMIALRQARARYQAAVQNRILQQQLYDSERKRFALGASVPYNVTQQQRDLMAAQNSEMAALAAYVTARIALDRTTGAILAANHVSLAEARDGQVMRESVIPAPRQ